MTEQRNRQKKAQATDCQIGISIYKQRLDWTQQCIESALKQIGDYRICVTARTDGKDACDLKTLMWLREKAKIDSRFLLIEGKKQLGTFGSYKKIFCHSTSEYLCQLDADDWLEEDAVSRTIHLLKAYPDSPFAYTDCHEVDNTGRKISEGMRSKIAFKKDLMLVQFITFHMRMIRRSAYELCGGYNQNLLYAGDYDLSLKLSELGEPTRLIYPAYNYRIHPENTSKLKKNLLKQESLAVAKASLMRRGLSHIFELYSEQGTDKVLLNLQKGPIIITGMHRSGTSLLAGVLEKLGLNLGDNLIPGDKLNPDGYKEDSEVVKINRLLFQRTFSKAEKGWPDWGWKLSKESEDNNYINGDIKWKEQARDYLIKRKRSKGFYGFKDPRSSLLLEEWTKIEPSAKAIGVYRNPWEIIEALQALEPRIFSENPHWGIHVWMHYNQALINFHRKHPEKIILIKSTTLKESPNAISTALSNKWKWPKVDFIHGDKRSPESLIREDRLCGLNNEDALIDLYQIALPKCWKILNELDSASEVKIEKSPSSQSKLRFNKGKNLKKSTLAVIITSHNKGVYLLDAIASIEKNAESSSTNLIIIDDGSTEPETIDIVKRLEDAGYFIYRQQNKGLPTARNIGAAICDSEYLLFLDDDNRLLKPYLQFGPAMLKQYPEIDVVYGDKILFGAQKGLVTVGTITPDKLWQKNFIDNCTVMRRAFFEKCGGYNPELTGLGFEDWDLWLNGLSQSRPLQFGYINEPCFDYRVRNDSMVHTLLADKEKQKLVMEIFRKRYGSKVGRGGLDVI